MTANAQPTSARRQAALSDPWPPAEPVLLFDGVCHLCQRSVRFVLRHERRPALLFCTLQSPAGRDLLERHGLDPGYTGSLVLIAEGKARTRSDAALFLARHLRAPWSWIRAFRLLPRPWRDWLYDIVAKRRYRWFGRDESFCLIPDARLRARLIDDLPKDPSDSATR
ncbi:MAG TPA: DCC1-like thiol-disulfide oxidoreductase family protein [Opitutaceae bacterium]